MKSRSQIPVAVFLTAFEAGGTERQMIELIRRLDGRFAVHVACFKKTGAWLPKVAETARSVVEFPIHGFARPSTARQLARFVGWCRSHQFAVVQTCDFYSNVFGLVGAAAAGVPVRIGSRRELNPDKSAAQLRLQRAAYRAATRIVANSRAAAAYLRDEGVDDSIVAVIPNGLDTAGAPARPQRDRITRVITVANLRAEKSHETLIATAALLAHSCPDLRYTIVGDGPRRSELETLARVKGVEGVVEFTGHREDVPSLLAGADVFVLPSRSEAFPNGVLEAMAAGLPVVACAVGGLVELVKPGVTGLLVPPDDATAMAGALREIVADPRRANAMGAAGRHEARSRFSFERMVDAFETLYEDELAARRPLRSQAAQAGI